MELFRQDGLKPILRPKRKRPTKLAGLFNTTFVAISLCFYAVPTGVCLSGKAVLTR